MPKQFVPVDKKLTYIQQKNEFNSYYQCKDPIS